MPTKEFDTKQFQWDFFSAVNRYPAMIAGWGSGKTLWSLMKGVELSKAYKDNLGVIVRSEGTKLRDSTMKDFTRLTNIHVPQGTNEAKYANGSSVLFRNAKDLSGLQNVNIGWFYIEQAEEFPTDTQFQLLRGRLRRVLTPKVEVQERLMNTISHHTSLPALKKVSEDWQFLSGDALNKEGNRIIHPELKENPEIKDEDKFMSERDIAELALVNQLGIPLRQGIVIANANGHNWCWKMFIKSPQPMYSCVQATGFDNAGNIPSDTLIDWADMKITAPAKYKQYVMNCHDEVDLDACYYVSIMNKLRANNHICHVAYDPSVRVHLSLDIGLDCTAIWFLQVVKGRRNLIDYYENTGKYVDHYAKVLDDRGYNYGKLILPHDGAARSKTDGATYAKCLKDMGYNVLVNTRIKTKDVGINLTANALPSFYIDEDKCKDGIEALDHYRREFDEENKVYREYPLHDWASHPCDSLKEMCQALKAGKLGSVVSITKGQVNKWSKKYKRTG
ncbi:hypothetical protein LCGC14_0361940 [marine sediment metagenome]|uniref:Phage terminase large subunit N-terminal domain-containing protein n=1 Tax=marine sediment metagenome TaxID=412755 RepID=A0A0F9VUQ6_9ZZZZ